MQSRNSSWRLPASAHEVRGRRPVEVTLALANKVRGPAGAARITLPELTMNSDDNASVLHNDVRGGLARWQLKRVKDYIEANLGSIIRAADLARIAQQSVSHFSRTFTRSVGYTPHAYVMRQRMLRAQDIMLSSQRPLSRIALECGMADQ